MTAGQFQGSRVNWAMAKALAGPACGIAFFILTLVGLGMGSPFQGTISISPEESGRLTATVLERNREDVMQSSRFTIAGLTFLFPFLGYLYRWLRADDGETGWMAPTALAAGIVTAGLLAINIQIELAAAQVPGFGEDFPAARALGAMAWSAHLVSGASIAALIGATALATITTSREIALPRLTGWLSLSLVLIVFFVAPWVRVLLLISWVLVISGTMVWRVIDMPTAATAEDRARPLIYERRS